MRNLWISIAIAILAVVSCATAQCWEEINISKENSNKTDKSNHILSGYTNFAFRLLQNFIAINGFPKDYVFLAPMNVWSTLAVLYLGAENSTFNELEDLLGFTGMNKMDIVNQLHQVNRRFRSRNSSSTLLSENTMYVQEDEPIREECTDNLFSDFQVDLVKLNLTEDPEINQIIDGINALVAFQTNGRITELIPLKYVDATTRLFMVNTASLYGIWENPFDAHQTRNRKFYIDSNHSMIVEFMHQNNFFPYGKSSILKCSAIEMNFLNSEVSAIILLPDNPVTKLDELIADLNDTILNHLVEDMQVAPVSLSIPKTHLEQVVDLKEILKKFDLKHIFDPRQADLSGFSQKPGFHLRNIRHLPFIEINERGTVPQDHHHFQRSLIRRSENIYLPFRVNRPFLILFYHKTMKTVLFTGLINRPTF